MYEENEAGFVLRGPADAHPVLAGVSADGRLEGPLFTLLLKQSYRNLCGCALEVSYTFPLPHGAVLLELAAEWGGRRLEGRVLARADAEHQYEGALVDGDLPILLEPGADGLFSASIGNLQPGEQIVLVVRTAQWLAFEAGRLRLTLPTTIAPRSGSARSAGLLPHQVPAVSMQAEYPLALRITVAGALVASAIECPTHSTLREKSVDGIVLSLAPSARLDRDVVLLVTPRTPRASMLLCAEHRGNRVAAAAFQLPAGSPRPRVALKLLVDCSGSMAGDSIHSAGRALQEIGAQLRPGDSVSLSRFGSTCDCIMPPSRVGPDTALQLQARLSELRADMGGTDIQSALAAVFSLPGASDGSGADVLLITDGQVWSAGPLVRAAQASAHRVFAIGVGSTPAEGVLREVATASGGACEFVTPGETLAGTALRMMRRIRQQPWAGLHVDWGAAPSWEAALPQGAFGGDTLIAFSGMAAAAGAPLPGPARLCGRDELGSELELARTDPASVLTGDTLFRMAAARRLLTGDEAEARELALEHQLLSTQTRGVLAPGREAGLQTAGAAGSHQVGTMLGAGWGGLGSVRSSVPPLSAATDGTAAVRPPSPSASAAAPCDAGALGNDTAVMAPPPSLRYVMATVAEHLAHGGSLQGLPGCCVVFGRIQAIEATMHRVLTLRLSPSAAWLLLGLWVARRDAGRGDSACAALLATHAAFIDAPIREQAFALFEQRLGRIGSDGG
jgi:Ca-activated chloride channel homolog